MQLYEEFVLKFPQEKCSLSLFAIVTVDNIDRSHMQRVQFFRFLQPWIGAK